MDLQTRVVYPTISKLAIRYRLEMESLAEEMRIFYVAMTRAKEKLVLIGSGRNLSRLASQWTDSHNSADWFLADFRLAGDRTWLAWLGLSLIRHRESVVLRALAGCGEDSPAEFNQEIWDYTCRWQTSFWSGQELLPLEKEGEEIPDYQGFFAKIKKGEPVESSGQWTEEVSRRLNWVYSDSRYIGRAAKVSVTGLAESRPESASLIEALPPSRSLPGQSAVDRPEFLKESRGLNAAERGTALHLVMQHLDFPSIGDEADIRRQIDRMVDDQVLTTQQAAAVPISAISAFLASSLGQRLRRAEDLQRETPFTLALPVGEVYPDLAGAPEKVLIQGVIDLMFREAGQWVIVDYKTGHAGLAGEALQAKFALQLDYYARAVARHLGCSSQGKICLPVLRQTAAAGVAHHFLMFTGSLIGYTIELDFFQRSNDAAKRKCPGDLEYSAENLSGHWPSPAFQFSLPAPGGGDPLRSNQRQSGEQNHR